MTHSENKFVTGVTNSYVTVGDVTRERDLRKALVDVLASCGGTVYVRDGEGVADHTTVEIVITREDKGYTLTLRPKRQARQERVL